MQKQNTVSANGVTIAVSNTQLPYSNNFVQHSTFAQEEPNEVQAYVKCTANSKEPGRIYFVAYSKQNGKLIECYTIN